MKKEYLKQERAIYMWVLEKNGDLKKYPPITRYEERKYPFITYYTYRDSETDVAKTVKSSSFDRFVNDKVCSFIDDDNKVKATILSSLKKRLDETQKNYNRAKQRWEKFNNGGYQNITNSNNNFDNAAYETK